ncbi:hypothetical protein B9Z55_019043 [Caenorhabditis nigoni]|uniref:G-protein coupled receptors family 1 profile domain-containing protein n=1 Tax=Caenorhabditis nigoni TaxID=1611254 RepID=A0A2G5TGP6_9PELO|nr:hypothetical protein B9Z55_019043 [Caenorhabditis nigoni]
MASNFSEVSDGGIEDTPMVYNYKDPTSFFASVLMIVNGIFGLVCNAFIVYIFIKERKERTAFNVICMIRAIVNFYVLTTNHLALFVPMTLLGKPIISKALETWAICMSNSLYMANEYLTVVIALNRFISLFFPLYYAKLCGMKPTIGILVVMYMYRIGAVTKETINYTAIHCYVRYYVEFLSWSPDFDPQCQSNSGIMTFMAVTFGIVSLLNAATFLKIFKFYKIGVFGVVCNFLIVYMFKKEKSIRSSFNLICVFRAFINLYVLITMFLICFLPTIVLGYSIYHPLLEAFFIILSNTFYLGNEYQTILVAANRFCALFFPLHYSKFFGYKSTMIMLFAIYGYRFVALFIQSFFFFDTEVTNDVECLIFFSSEKLTWTITDDPSCSTEDNILLVVSITFLVVFILNIAIFTKVVIYQKVCF